MVAHWGTVVPDAVILMCRIMMISMAFTGSVWNRLPLLVPLLALPFLSLHTSSALFAELMVGPAMAPQIIGDE